MTKKRWKASMKRFASHIDPQKEEELKWIKIEMENNVKRIIKLVKSSVNQGNRDSNQKRRAELIQLVEDFNKQYQHLYGLYDDIRGEVRKKCRTKDDEEEEEDDDGKGSSSSASSLDSESYFSPEEASRSGSSGEFLRRKPSSRSLKGKSETETETETEIETENVILKDTLTSATEVKETINVDSDSQPGSPSSSYGRAPGTEEFIRELGVQSEETESMTQKLMKECSNLKEKLAETEEQLLSVTKKYELREGERVVQMKELEDQVGSLKHELKNSMAQTRELEENVKVFEQSKMQTLAHSKDLDDQVAGLKIELETSKRELEEKIEFKSNEVKQLEEEIESLKLELESSHYEKAALEEKMEVRSNELKQSKEINSSLQAKLAEIETRSKSKEDELSAILRDHEENDKQSVSRIHEMKIETNNLQLQVESLRVEKTKLGEELKTVSKERSDQTLALLEKIEFLQQEIVSLGNQKSEMEISLKKKSQELSECHSEIEAMKQKITPQEMPESKEEKNDSPDEKELHKEISSLSKTLTEKEDEISSLNNLHNELRNMETQKSILKLKLEKERQESTQDLTEMENRIRDLESKVAEQQTIILEQEQTINKLNEEQRQMQAKYEEANTNFQNAERKIDEMLEELRKKYEDSLRILSRRIRVAEQLHTENKEWYLQTREKFEQENKDLKELTERHEIGVQKIKEMSAMANDALTSLDTVTLRFEKYTSNFINRISSMSCELNFAKEWVSRKHKAIAHVKGDLDCLLTQLDEKEAEIWQYREKVWKSENKVRELEKMIKQSEDAMCDLKEEKREAIRQLCVWIDYHRSRCDFYKKMLAEVGFIKAP